MQEAPLSVMPVPQVNILGSFNGTHRKRVESRGRTTTRPTDSCNPRVECNSSDLISNLVREGRRSFGRRIRRRTGSRAVGSGRRRSQGDGQTPRRRMLQVGRLSKQQCQGQSCNREYTDNTAAEEDTHRNSCEHCGAQPSQAQQLSARAMQNPRDTQLLALSQRACAIIPALGLCIASPCIASWICSSTHPARHWPACFDQTCGHPGEGPLTTLDSPEVAGMIMTPTQGFMTCDT